MMKEIGMSIPDFFTCPISLELFSDPVTLCTGQTYDRPSIERWLASGNLICPVTMQKLLDISMVPNLTLRHLIDQWLHKGNTHHDDHGFYKVGSKIMFYTSLKNVLESQNSPLEQKIQVLEQIICLSNDLHRKNEGLIQMGFLSLILGIIFESKNTQETMVLVEKSLNCALKLVPFSSLSDLNILLEEQKFETFKNLLHEGSNLVKVALCNIIEIASLSKEYNLSTKIGNDTKILQSLLDYINNYPQNSELSEAGVKAILSLISSSSSSLEKRHENLIKEGLIESMVTYILETGIKKNKDEILLLKVIKALEQILDHSESAKTAFMVHGVLSRGIKALIKMVFRVSGDDEGSESAVNCLLILCDESMIAREEAIYGGILTQLLLLLQSQCSTRTKTRARMLLKLLRSMWPKDPKQQ
ncbi:U-box domain-containing protein 25-like isoform X3 [Amaranthus tricolor]|uniref:U-box domain-containing protein 25-like isoform X1 n=1 Tax=Amaranthus tricolor TaxID=29722 RepID=UPI0025843ADD|nr:U-box domain-containing protein 25-like isoform X1 [Amaranthus tricolor]XP_057542403.1 U-box domain-containing protein 25-like isoform X2 [Amaranthus tricolor]XP_057542404.1 U-box domain-containing protein 25-like isoform X3 [Amaranthus tricolor]